jgi:hypothetical protein
MDDERFAALQAVVATLRDADLVGVASEEDCRALRLWFTFAGLAGGEEHDLLLILWGVRTLTLDRTGASGEACFVGEAALERAGEGALRLRVEGAVTLDAVCEQLRVFRES